MHAREASHSHSHSKPCFNACFLSPFLTSDSENSNNNTSSNSNRVNKEDEFATAISSSFYPHTHFTNHESLPSLQDSYNNFIKSFPQFSLSSQLDQIRAREYHHLNHSNICFDYTGYGLFSYPSIANSSSSSSTSSSFPLNTEQSFFDVSHKSMNLQSQILYGGQDTELESSIRQRIMTFMNISEAEYAMVFIANEVSAFKLIADSFKFQSNGELLTVYDHNSEALEMMIQSCNKQGVHVLSAEFSWPNLGIEWRKLKKMITSKKEKRKSNNNNSLFVFPLYSKVTGAPYSYVWMSMAQENGWHVLLDVCALRPKEMDTLGMSMFKPDFMVCSFYKVFGHNPSGFGCLFIKKSSISALKNSSNVSSIGIVSLVPAFKHSHGHFTKEETDEEIVEQSVEEIECRGLEHADRVGLIEISSRSKCLINWLVNALMSLQHPHNENRFSLIRIYGPQINSHRGPVVAFNIFDWKGEKIDPSLVQKLADRNNICLSSSFLKNIRFFDRNEQERHKAMETKASESGILVVTATLGFLTNFEDIYRLWAFVSRFLDADFLEKERWRYTALNQQTIEL